MKTRVHNCELYYETTGRGSLLLFVHGFPLSGEMWRPTVERLSANYRCVVPDLRGHGRSDATPTADMSRYSDDLAAVLDAVDAKQPVVLIGLSMGGYVAFEFYRSHRDRVRAMVLADTQAIADSPEARTKRETMVSAVAENGSRAVADAMIDKLFAPGVDQNLRSRWHEIMSRTPSAGVIAALRAMAGRPDSTPTLAKIDCPTLIVVGEHDTITPPDVHHAMHAAIRGSQIEIIADAGHMSPLEKPDRFASTMTSFLENLH